MIMIVLHEGAAAHRGKEPLICTKCKRGKIGNISKHSAANISRRGKPPPDERGESVEVKCPVCNTLWTLTIEN